jgi:hypothetical protein
VTGRLVLRRVAEIAVLTPLLLACTASVHASSGKMLIKRANYGQGWPFRAESVFVTCTAATGHTPSLSLIVNGKTFQLHLDGSTSPQLPIGDLAAGQADSGIGMASFAQRVRLAC